MSKVYIVKILTKEKHPDADKLYVYTITDDIQVVANSENEYNIDDHVIYVSVGSKLLDGTKISRRKIRGIYSYGMLLGLSNLEVKADVTKDYCLEESIPTITRTKLKHQPWPSIESFANKINDVHEGIILGVIDNLEYRSKIKLHGTNAAIHIAPDGEVVAQKRTSNIYIDQDNCGFAQWVENNKEYFHSLKTAYHVIIHGEWAGPRIQKNIAVSEIEKPIFAVFAIQCGLLESGKAEYQIDPEEIKIFLGENPCHILPWYSSIFVNYYEHESLLKTREEIELQVKEVERVDPWVADTFNINGTGEGLVFYPYFNSVGVKTDLLSKFMFKAKGELHKVKKTKQLVPIDIETLSTLQEFAESFITEARLLQAVTEACENKYEVKYIGSFLEWITNDIRKESINEIQKNNLKWKDVHKFINTTAKQWYISKFYCKLCNGV